MKISIYKYVLIIALLLIFVGLYSKHFIKYKYSIIVEHNIIELGKTHLQDSSIIICGLIRDGEKNIEHIKKLTYSILDGVKKYKVLIVENDSVDNTRKLLLEWSKTDSNIVVLGCGTINIDKCNLNLQKTINHDHDLARISKMVYLRNIYMNYITKNLADYDYTIMCDFDIYGVLYNTGLYDTFYRFLKDGKEKREDNKEKREDNKEKTEDNDTYSINAIGANSFMYNNDTISYYNSLFYTTKKYYDPYAFVDYEYDELYIEDELFEDDYKMKKINKLLQNTTIQKVLSCFGGLIVYRTTCLLGKKYDTVVKSQNKDSSDQLSSHSSDKKSITTCEHVGLNLQIPNIYINPVFEYWIINNP